jgi:hypothetical protein
MLAGWTDGGSASRGWPIKGWGLEGCVIMDTTGLMLSLLFGAIGMGFFMFGKREGRMVPLLVGVGLMVVPYFIANVVVMVVACGALTVVPLFVREG